MNTNLVAMHISGAINMLRAMQASLEAMPERQQRKVAGSAHIDTVIAGLEMAKAEVLGEAHPVHSYPTLDLEPELLAIIDG